MDFIFYLKLQIKLIKSIISVPHSFIVIVFYGVLLITFICP